MGLSKKQEQEYAKLLYVEQMLTQKEIAERCGVTEKTVGNWIEKYGWEKLRQSLLVTKPHNIQLMYAHLTSLNEEIQQQGKAPDSKQLDALSKLTASIKNLEVEMGIGEMFTVGSAFIAFVRKIDVEAAKKVYSLFDAFIQSRK